MDNNESLEQAVSSLRATRENIESSQSNQVSTPQQPPRVYAGFWIRFLAVIIDSIVLGIFIYILANFFRYSYGVQILLGALYYIGFHGTSGQTLGKKILGLKVVNEKNEIISWTHAIIRYVGRLLSGLVFAIGFIWVGFHKEKRGWHDLIAGTYVIYINK